MAKKSRTRKSKSNDSQKKLLALVLIILFVGLGVFLVVSSFAAKGGNKGKPGSGGTVTYIDSQYGLIANGGVFGGSSILTITDKTTGQPLTSLNEDVGFEVQCWQNGLVVATGSTNPSRYLTLEFTNRNGVWTSGGADCLGNLRVYRNGLWQSTAPVNYTVAP